MTAPTRLIAAVVIAGAWITGVVLAQAAGAPASQGQPPAGQTPAGQPPGQPADGRGQEPGQRGAGPAGARQGGGGRRGGFTQYTRPLASPDVLLRGKALYDTNCASCHAVDLRGTVDGKYPNLLRSGIALRDQKGELVAATVAKHSPAINLIETDTVAIAEYIHSVHATMGGQGSPPGRNPTNVVLNVLVGDAKAGEATFGTLCGSCHSVTGNLRAIATKFPDPRALQNGWVSGSASAFAGGGGGGGRGGGGAAGLPATVSMADGSKLQGTLVRQDDFLVVLMLPDGTRKSMARTDGVPKVEVRDPMEGHKNAIVKLAFEDSDNKKMHDITAYLWTIK
jgi:cytochrome c oxidase cbb3-type subunit III